MLRRVALLALFLAGVYLTGFVAALSTYTVEMVKDIRWDVFINITASDSMKLLPGNWSVQFGRNAWANLTALDYAYRPEVLCDGSCSFSFYFPAHVSGARVDVTGGDYSLNVMPSGEGTLVTVDVNAIGPARAELELLTEYEFVFKDYTGGARDAVQQLIYSDGSIVNITSNTPTLIPVYPISGIIILHERAEILGPSGCTIIGNLIGDFRVNVSLILPETFGGRCRVIAYYVLTTSIDATLTRVMTGVYRIGGVLKDEEGRPVQGRRVLIMLEGNLTKPIEAVTGADGSFSQIIFAPPSREERRLFVRFIGELGLRPSSKVLVIPAAAEGHGAIEVPSAVYGFLAIMIASFAALILFSFIRGARRASSIIQTRRRVLR